MSALNPGIVETVLWLNRNGFETCDSGDGETHDYECDSDFPYVHMMVKAEHLAQEAKRLRELLKKQFGIDTVPLDESMSTASIQATYDPAADSDLGTLSLFNVKLSSTSEK